MKDTNTTWDPTLTFGTDSSIVWKGKVFPIIRGASDTDSGDNGDATSGGAGDGTSNETGDGGAKDDKVFTQDQLNAIVTRETQKATRGKLDPKDLGFDSTKAMKDWVDAQKARDEESKSEDDKARDEAIKAAADEARSQVLTAADERYRRAEFLVQAVDHGIVKEARNDAYLLAPTLDAWAEVAVDDKGNVQGFDDAFFEELKEKKPFLFGTNKGDASGSSNDIGAGARGTGQLEPGVEDLKNKYSALR